MSIYTFVQRQMPVPKLLESFAQEDGTLSTLYFTPTYAMLCGYTTREYTALVSAGSDLLTTVSNEHYDGFRMSVGMIAEEKMPMAFYMHVQRQDRQPLTLSCLGEHYMEQDGEHSLVCLIVDTQELETERGSASELPSERLDRLTGINCKERGTSCSDQLTRVLRAVL